MEEAQLRLLCGVLSKRWDLYIPGGSIPPERPFLRRHPPSSLDGQMPCGRGLLDSFSVDNGGSRSFVSQESLRLVHTNSLVKVAVRAVQGCPAGRSLQAFPCSWNLLLWNLREGSDLSSLLLLRGLVLARMSPHTGSCTGKLMWVTSSSTNLWRGGECSSLGQKLLPPHPPPCPSQSYLRPEARFCSKDLEIRQGSPPTMPFGAASLPFP